MREHRSVAANGMGEILDRVPGVLTAAHADHSSHTPLLRPPTSLVPPTSSPCRRGQTPQVSSERCPIIARASVMSWASLVSGWRVYIPRHRGRVVAVFPKGLGTETSISSFFGHDLLVNIRLPAPPCIQLYVLSMKQHALLGVGVGVGLGENGNGTRGRGANARTLARTN